MNLEVLEALSRVLKKDAQALGIWVKATMSNLCVFFPAFRTHYAPGQHNLSKIGFHSLSFIWFCGSLIC